MNIHEHQAKALLKSYGLPVASGVAIFKPDEAEAAARSLPGPLYVVKSQIHAGGRGKGKFKEMGPDAKGGVRLAKSPAEVVANAKEMLGHTLVTKQTGAAGKQVNRLYIEDGADIARELYCSLLVDRETGEVAFVVSTEGGMDIETVAHDTPDKIVTVDIDPTKGVTAADADKIDRKIADHALSALEVDAAGLDAMDRRYLTTIATNYGGGPVGVETMAAALSEPRDAIEDIIEPYLIPHGFLQRTPRGRLLTPHAFRHLGLAVPQARPADQGGLFRRAGRRGEAEVPEGVRRQQAAARRALHETELDEIGLDDLLDGVARLR